MFCDRCGANLEASQNFCPTCGKSVRAVPVVPRRGRIAGHVRLLAIFWLAISALRVIPGLVLLFLFRPNTQLLPPDVPFPVDRMLQSLGIVFLVLAALGLVAAWGLLARQSWARMFAIVFGCFSLLDVPLGTALGIYTLWVLLPAESEREYRESAVA